MEVSGGQRRVSAAPRVSLPSSDPDFVVSLPTLPQSALLYRLNGDVNPLHADPAFARKAGFPRPILHGLCTLGLAGHAVLRAAYDYRACALKVLSARFTAPLFPGESVAVEMWRASDHILFRARAVERDVKVLDASVLRYK